MDLALNRRRKQLKVVSDDLKDLYPHDINFFKVYPGFDITLSEFEDLALDRLKVLRILELAGHKGHKQYSADWKNCVYEELHKENLKKFVRLIKSSGISNPNELDLQARRADHISHFILRLAYCRSEELRRWFLNREMELFKLRFMELSKPSVESFLDSNNFSYKPISNEEKDSLQEELLAGSVGINILDQYDFYKVHFSEVTALVKNRKVYLKHCFAYIPNTELVVCILTKFRAHLSEALAFTNKKLPGLDDERINDLLNNLHQAYTGNDYSSETSKSDINMHNLDKYAKQHFPMCMRHIHEIFRSTHHLKHSCRLQYNLFLKGIGLSFDDCMQFWREEFTKVMDGDKFDKQYAYNVKHTYGKVGSMTNYSPYSCLKVISSSVGPGEHHGCPFKHWDAPVLKQKLNEYGISTQGVSDISDTAQKGHYQIACGKCFEYTHSAPNKNSINHPNQYFEDSLALAGDKSGNSSGTKQKSIASNSTKMEVD